MNPGQGAEEWFAAKGRHNAGLPTSMDTAMARLEASAAELRLAHLDALLAERPSLTIQEYRELLVHQADAAAEQADAVEEGFNRRR